MSRYPITPFGAVTALAIMLISLAPSYGAQDWIKRLPKETQAQMLMQQMRTDEAIEILMSLYRDASDDFLRGKAEAAIGMAHFHIGDFRTALRLYQAAAKKLTKEGYEKHEPSAMMSYQSYIDNFVDRRLAQCYMYLGKTKAAIAVCKRIDKSLMSQQQNAKTELAKYQALSARYLSREVHGDMLREVGRLDEAKAVYAETIRLTEEGLKLHRKTMGGGTGGESTHHGIRARLFFHQGDAATALRESHAWETANKGYMGDRFQMTQGEVFGYELRARILEKLGRDEEAVEALGISLSIAMDRGTPDAKWQPTWGQQKIWMSPPIAARMGALQHRLGNLKSAEKHYKLALELDERIYAAASSMAVRKSLQQKTGFFEREEPVAKRFARLLAEQGRWAESFAVAERGRTRLLLDNLGGAPMRETGAAALPADLLAEDKQRSRELTLLVQQLQMARFSPALDERAVAKKLKEKQKAFAAFRTAAALKHPGFAVFHTASTVTSDDVLGLFRRHAPLNNTALVSYCWTEHALIGFRFDGSEFRGRILTTDMATLRNDIARLRQAMETRDENWRESAQRLYATLLAPFERSLEQRAKLIVSADGPLRLLSWPALVDGSGRTVIERWAITQSPSASLLRVWAKPAVAATPSGDVLAVANPDGSLPFAQQEGRVLERLYPGARALFGGSATESELFALAPRARIVHLATHGVINRSRPEFSHLVLASSGEDNLFEDGLLDVHEIVRKLDVSQADLVVLSACQTLLSGDGGDESASLAGAFLFAGAREVMATLWSVQDEATARLMERFYGHYRDNAPPASALRSAMIEELRAGRHPYFWAGLQLIGDR